MNLFRLVLPIAAIGTAATLLVPSSTDAFTVLGTSLSTNLRHFRIYDNFTDASANDNVTPDTNFPGYTGVEMAIWKGGVEWGSRLHGNGNGDPSQVGGLGSGGANFDFYFMGNALGVGGIGDNICSELAGSSGGTLAFTEFNLVGFNGWRMRFYSGWTWADGPLTNIPANQIDIQGVATHEFGHALGLDHTGVVGSTMEPAINGTGVSGRSIAADDISGVQSIYAVASATKPVITGVAASLGSVTITGTGFTATGNQVWFTQGTPGNLTSVTVTNLASTGGGTSITATVPANAGPGDVLVKTSGSGNASLSNAWPFTPGTTPTCPSPVNFCFPSGNSADPNGAIIGSVGTQFISQNNFVLTAYSCPPLSAGLFYFGPNEVFVPFGNGFRCVGGSTRRLPIVQTSIFGDASYNLNVNAGVAAGVILPGTTWKFQFWFRDTAAGGAFFNLTDGLSVDFCP